MVNVWPWRVFATLRNEIAAVKYQHDNVRLLLAAQRTRTDQWRQRYTRVNDEYSKQQADRTELRVKLAEANATLSAQNTRIDRLEFDLDSARLDLRRTVENVSLKVAQSTAPAQFERDPFAEYDEQVTQYVDLPGATAADIEDHIATAMSVKGT